MNKKAMYFHGGSSNHGCEAIIRATHKIFNENMELFSFNPGEDFKYEIDKLVNIIPDIPREIPAKSLNRFKTSLLSKLSGSEFAYILQTHKEFFDQVRKNQVFLSVGGDNYCYRGCDILGYYNEGIHKRGGKTVLWGCSFEPPVFSDKIKRDIELYNLIIAREKRSFDVLKQLNSRTLLLPDPAFQLDIEKCNLPKDWKKEKMIGINISPLIEGYSSNNMIFINYIELVKHIIENTDYRIALIPHVVTEKSDDRRSLKKLYDYVENPERVIMFDDMNCMQLKYIISNCRFFIGARTHSTIAAYSTCVPTIVTGYSVKALGIAEDIFGTNENYVVPVRHLATKYDLTNAFIWLMDHEKEIQNYLVDFMPSYCKKICEAKTIIEEM